MTAPTAIQRNLAVFLDGTWNTDDDNTNVFRLKSLCAETPVQLRYYSKGVGTNRGEVVIGGAFGFGLDSEVISAYRWLVEHYQPNDRIYVFGFSRGAFTARSLCGFISKCGLLKVGSPLSLKQLYERYRMGAGIRTVYELGHADVSKMSLEEQWIKAYSQEVPIYFQGLWDTVGSLGVPFGHFPRVSRSQFSFLEVDLRINYYRAYHALAIDEHRKAFAPTLWRKTTHDNAENYPPREIDKVEQRWFSGAHADVGGGYPDGLLSQTPARWILSKAAAHGLLFTGEITADALERGAQIHNSFREMLNGWYRISKLCIPYHRIIGDEPIKVGHDTTANINETIDASVFDRWRRDKNYRPENLVEWAKRRSVDPGNLMDSVLAKDCNVLSPS